MREAAAPMAGNGELGGVALWSASACAGYTGVESATRRTRLGHSPQQRTSGGGGMCGEAARPRRRSSGEPE